MSQEVAVTGTRGFLGPWVLAELKRAGYQPRVIASTLTTAPEPGVVPLADRRSAEGWQAAIGEARLVVHLAGRAHVGKETPAVAEREYYRGNLQPARALAEACAALGVERVVFASSIKALGERSDDGRPLRADDAPSPEDAYGRSKLAAEQTLFEGCGCDVAALRFPLLYGPGARGNLAALKGWIGAGRPVPVPRKGNRRSMLGVRNAASLVHAALTAPEIGRRSWLASDVTWSTAELCRAMGEAMGRRALVLPLPRRVLKLVLGPDRGRRIVGSLEVDDSDTRSLLRWSPPVTPREELQAMLR